MEPEKTPGEVKEPSQQAKTLTTEEIAQRERLVAFLQAFVKAMLQTGYYSQDHPQAKKAKEGLYDTFRALLGTGPEVNFLARFEKGVGKDVYIDGVTTETTSLNAVMTSSQSDIFLPKFADYFYRRGLLSFSMKREVSEEEFNLFVDIMSESRRSQFEDALQRGKELTRELVDNQIVHVSTVFDDDVVKIGRGVPWRVEMALLRLRKDLSVIPMFRHIAQDKMTEVKRKVIEDVIRPIARPAYFVDLLLNASYVLGDVEGLRDIDVETEVINCVRPDLLSEVCETFADKLPSAGTQNAESGDAINTVKRLTRKLGVHMIETKNTEAINTLYRLYTIGILDAKELPDALRTRIRVERLTDEFLQFPERYMGALRGKTSAGTYKSAVGTIERIFPELIRRGEIEKAAELILLVASHKVEEGASLPEIPALARGALEQVASPVNLNLLKNALNSSHQQQRKHILDIFGAIGTQAVPALLDALAVCEDASIRKSICQHISAEGKPAAPYLLEALHKTSQQWYLSRNILGILGEIGSSEAQEDVSHFVGHPHARVREEALATLGKLMREGAEPALARALNDQEPRVVARATALLGAMRSRHPKALEFFQRTLKPESEAPEIIKSQVCKALGSLGDVKFPDGATSAEILEKILLTGKSGKFFGLVKGPEAFPSYLRIEAAAALGRISTPGAKAALKDCQKDKDAKVREAVENALRHAAK